jgi:YggT family protein
MLRDISSLIIGLLEILLIFRFVLKLLSASTQSGFVMWVYQASQPLLQPFLFAFPTPSVRGGFQLEFVTLFAIFAYAFLGYFLQELFGIMGRRESRRTTIQGDE